MVDYRGTKLAVGDKVAIYWGYNELKTAEVHQIKGNSAKVKIIRETVGYFADGNTPGFTTKVTDHEVISKWKRGECMIKLEDVSNVC